jgi:antagonist of KipI
MPAMSILRAGMFTTVQDLGRWGFQSRGVSVSGAMDWYSHRLANRLLGNDPRMATLEVTMMGPQIRFEEPVVFAVTGAVFQLTLEGLPIEMGRVVEAATGAILKFGARVSGARAYIAVAGGIDVPEVLGSRSTHTLTGTGGLDGRALRSGDRLNVSSAPTLTKNVKRGSDPLFTFFDGAKLRVIAADERLVAHLASQRFRISPQSDRMGYRLEGGAIGAPRSGIISTSVPTGAIQVPPAGQPILLMNDHATTGGYAIAGAVITADLPLAGQLAPGDWVGFEACSLDIANTELRLREAALGAA